MTNQIEQLRQRAVALCAEHGVTVRSYGQAWWLVGNADWRVCRFWLLLVAVWCQCAVRKGYRLQVANFHYSGEITIPQTVEMVVVYCVSWLNLL